MADFSATKIHSWNFPLIKFGGRIFGYHNLVEQFCSTKLF
nr:MAG TPA: hypothetical protein [Caudoviricetes sp.]